MHSIVRNFITTAALVVALLSFPPPHLCAESTRVLKGVVLDGDNLPLAGAGVFNNANRQAVVTDADGAFSIRISASSPVTLTFSFIGMEEQKVVVAPKDNDIRVVMKLDNQLEGSIIVGAYGTRQRREDLTGSAFQVNSDVLKDRPKGRVDNLLQGLVPGLAIEPNTDVAGSTRTRFQIRVRGDGSLSASNEPMWIIDGVPVYTGGTTNQMPGMSYTVSPLSYLDPDDIESITVLKDADQVTIYGANGSNGVILVTTKSGGKGQPTSVYASVRYGVSTPDYSTMFRTMNAQQYMVVAKEAWQNAGYSMNAFPLQDNDYNSYSTTSTDWAKVFLGTGNEFNARVGIRGGSKDISNDVSMSYYKNEGIVQSDRQQRFEVHSKQDFSLWKGADLTLNMRGSFNINDIFPLGKSYVYTLPVYEPYLLDGYSFRLYNKLWDSTAGDDATGGWVMRKFWANELPARELNINTQRSVVSVANLTFNWIIGWGFSVRSLFGVNYQHSHEDRYDSRYTLDGLDSDNKPSGYSSRADASYLSWNNSNILNFDNSFGKFKFGLYGGLELHHQGNKTQSVSGSGFTNDRIQEIAYATYVSQYSTSNSTESRSMSYFGRMSLSYDSRYYMSLNARRDGNSSFGRYSRWQTYWSAGASWNIHREKFWNIDRIKMLKLKASYGTAGNAKVDASSAYGTYAYSSSYSYRGAMGAVVSAVPNPGLSWESKHIFNSGVRVEIDRIADVELEFYHNRTDDLISKMYVSRTITENSVYGNFGSLEDRGVEMSLTSYNISHKNFRWRTNFNIAHNKNKILKMYNGASRSFGNTIWKEGYDSGTFYLVRWAGVDPSDGMPMWYDLNGNITKTYSTDNRVVNKDKNSSPVCLGGLTNTFSMGNWQLSFQINYTIGGYALAGYALNYMKDGYAITDENQAVELYYYRWTTPGQQSAFPKVSQTSTKSAMSSTRFLYDKTSFTLSNVALSYNFPHKLLDKARLKGLSISLVGDNLYLFTPDQKKGFNSYKTMKYGYPVARTFTLSADISF